MEKQKKYSHSIVPTTGTACYKKWDGTAVQCTIEKTLERRGNCKIFKLN